MTKGNEKLIITNLDQLIVPEMKASRNLKWLVQCHLIHGIVLVSAGA